MNAEPLPAVAPRADLVGGLCWIGFGGLVAALAWRMDRFESQGGTLYTAPGLWPAILGILIAALGVVLVIRSLQRARTFGSQASRTSEAELVPLRQFVLAAGLMFVYALVLIGHGLPFWLGTAIFVTTFVFAFQKIAGRPSNARAILTALACGLVTAWVISLTFEKLFYVRLP